MLQVFFTTKNTKYTKGILCSLEREIPFYSVDMNHQSVVTHTTANFVLFVTFVVQSFWSMFLTGLLTDHKIMVK